MNCSLEMVSIIGQFNFNIITAGNENRFTVDRAFNGEIRYGRGWIMVLSNHGHNSQSLALPDTWVRISLCINLMLLFTATICYIQRRIKKTGNCCMHAGIAIINSFRKIHVFMSIN